MITAVRKMEMEALFKSTQALPQALPQAQSLTDEDILAEIGKTKNNIIIDADKKAKDAGSVKAGNMVILGAASPFIDMSPESIMDAIRKLFSRKGEEIVSINIKAFQAGREYSLSLRS